MQAWTLQPAGNADTEFLYRVYASTRLEELAPAGWPAEQTEAFLRSQFGLQDRHYRQHHPDASYDIVKVCGGPAGRLYVDRSADEIVVIDIALLPAYRRRGLGRSMLQTVVAEARSAGRYVSLHVERNNPALDLYRQLGFVIAGDDHGVYLPMHWPGARSAGTASAALAVGPTA